MCNFAELLQLALLLATANVVIFVLAVGGSHFFASRALARELELLAGAVPARVKPVPAAANDEGPLQAARGVRPEGWVEPSYTDAARAILAAREAPRSIQHARSCVPCAAIRRLFLGARRAERAKEH